MMLINKQVQIKKLLLDVYTTHLKYVDITEIDYLDELITKITEISDLGLIKLHIMNLADVSLSNNLSQDLMGVVFNIDELEPDTQHNILGESIELSNNIKLWAFLQEIDSESIERIKYKNKDVIISYSDQDGNLRHYVLFNLDFFIYTNTAELLKHIATIYDNKEKGDESTYN